ncbi:hypothetical protein IWW38_003706 [Coemansia aciculifera]|uniref:Uncharacterized protein n=1 Tax=Coemansia aciculifera TaxID=417176 RepID=A0ACC1M1K7_9FUNG|nr:hypothetical protein IWW38_003706 [Coemansia aciculifera]
MFSSVNIHNNDENAALGSVARTGKTGLLNSKLAGGGNGIQASKVFGSPAPTNTRTPGGKGMDGKQQTLQRAGLRDITQTPSNRRAAGLEERAPKTVKRIQGLFSPQTRNMAAQTQLHLEPEYAPPRPASPALNATEEFGCDLDLALVPMTQLSTAGARLRVLPPVDLALEILAEINVDELSFSMIPQPKRLRPAQLACRPRPLIASALYPTRIPQLKRKR